jgi:DsbC/DsbD-like thiol-disulfide interchange protein
MDESFGWNILSVVNSEMRLPVVSLLVAFAAGTLCAAGPPSVVSARAVLATNATHAGKAARLAVVAQIQPGYHINDHKPSLDYLIPTRVEFDDSSTVKVERVVYPRGKLRKFVFLDSPISIYEGEMRLGAVIMVNRSAKPGTHALEGKFMYQACNDHACLPPASVPLKLSVRVVPSSVALRPANSEIFENISFK